MKFLVINGPNLNLTQFTEPGMEGQIDFNTLLDYIEARCAQMDVQVDFFQSNHEGALIDEIHRAYFEKADGIIINAGGYTHTSIALMDALLSVSLPVIEVHLSDPGSREEFRHRSYVAMAARASVVGLGFKGYRRAMELLRAMAGR